MFLSGGMIHHKWINKCIDHINGLENENQMIFSTDEETFDKIQHAFTIKGLEVNIHQHNRTIQEKPTPNNTLNGEKLEAMKSGLGWGCAPSTLLFSTGFKVLTGTIRQEMEIKEIQMRKEEVKITLFTEIWYYTLETPKILLEKNIEKINEVSYVAGHRINLHKSIAFLFTTNEHRERGRGHTHIHNSLKENKKYLGINIAKEAKNLYNKNLKSLKKGTKTLYNGKTLHVCGLVEISLWNNHFYKSH